LQSDLPRLRDWFVRLLVLIGFLGMPVMVGMALVAEDGLVLALGEKWHSAVEPFQLLSLSGLFRIYSALFPMLFYALGRPDLNLKFNLFCAVLFPMCYFGAAAAAGMIGVCLVWMFVFPLVVMGLIHGTRHITGVGLLDLLRSQAQILGGTVFMAALVLSAQWLLADRPAIVRLLLASAVGVVAYGGPMYFCCRRTVLADIGILWRELKGTPAVNSANLEKVQG
jgi:O-antigen/teichoic acid export membrane protein